MILKISDIATVQSGLVLSRKEAKKDSIETFEYKRLTLRSLGEDGFLSEAELELYNAKEQLDGSSLTVSDDVIIRLFSPLCPILINESSEGLVIPSQLAVLKVKDTLTVLPAYLRWYLSQKEIQERVLFEEGGTAQRTIKVSTIMDLLINIPDIEKQRKAVQIDELSRTRERLYRELIQQERIYTENAIANIIGGSTR